MVYSHIGQCHRVGTSVGNRRIPSRVAENDRIPSRRRSNYVRIPSRGWINYVRIPSRLVLDIIINNLNTNYT
jgi:hypothetical protein